MQGEELVLMMDMNDDIYKSPFARKLAEIGFEEQFQKTNSADAPHSHAEGSKLSVRSLLLKALMSKTTFNSSTE